MSSALRLAHQRVQQQAVDDLHGHLLDVLVGAVDRVARLEADHAPPAAAGELRPRLRRRQPQRGELRIHAGRPVKHPHLPAQQHVALPVQPGHAGMCLVRRAVHQLRLFPLVIPIFLGHAHDGHRSLALTQGDLPALADAGRLICGYGQRHGDRPDGAGTQPHLADDAPIVGTTHKTGQRRHRADRNQLQVGQVDLRQRDFGKPGGPSLRLQAGFALQHAVDQRAAMRRNGERLLGH